MTEEQVWQRNEELQQVMRHTAETGATAVTVEQAARAHSPI
jgi:hypothetical protein